MSECVKCGKNAGLGNWMRGGSRCDRCASYWCLDCDQRPRAYTRIPGSPFRFRGRYCLPCLRTGAEQRRKKLVRATLDNWRRSRAAGEAKT